MLMQQLQKLKKTIFLLFWLIVVYSVTLFTPLRLNAQSIYSDNPKSYRKDDTKICGGEEGRINEKFCVYYRGYRDNETTNPQQALIYRNNMLYVLKREIDDYYEDYKIGREKKTKWFQTVLDILGIGLAFSGTVVRGERAKTVIGAVTGSFLAGRDSVNERFQLLQVKILTNKMESNRLEKWAEILGFMKRGIDEFPWDSAREHLQQYAFRGTYENALNSLVDETGAEVTAARNEVRVLGEVKQGVFELKIKNFDDYIKPRKVKADELDNKIEKVQKEIDNASSDDIRTAKTSELETLKTQQTNLLKNYQTIVKAILASGDFAVIEENFRDIFKNSPNVLNKFNTLLANIKNDSLLSAKDYDQFLLFINGIVGEDSALNNNFLTILEANKLQ